MAWKRFVVVVAAVFCMTSSSGGVYASDLAPKAASSDSAAALDHLGVCGPIHEAILRLGPKDDEGRLDIEPIDYELQAFGSWAVLMPAPTHTGISFAGHPPNVLKLHEFKGITQSALLYWEGTEEEKSTVLQDAFEKLTLFAGEPEPIDDHRMEWRGEKTRTVVVRPKPGQQLVMYVSCLATQEAFFATIRAADAESEGPTEAADAKTDTPAPILWLNRSIVGTLLEYGQPTQKPLVSDNGLVGLHYAEVEGPGGVPAEFWWWFNDGKAVYAAGEFPPPYGPVKARSSFRAFNEAMRGMYGAPVEEGPGEEPGDRHIVYTNGSQRLILTFLDPEGDPYFRIEAYDTTQLDKVGPELRPNPSLPKRFTPPPSDSGLSRDSFGREVGAG